MKQAVSSQKGFDADLQAVNEDQIVVLYRWNDGMILLMAFDDEMPAFTSKPVLPGTLQPPRGKDSVTTATGYVFRLAEPDPKGSIEFEDQRYTSIDIYDYVIWTDDDAVKAKYAEVLARAVRE